MDDFILGIIESTKELGSPFISESIWTEGLARYICKKVVEHKKVEDIWNEDRSYWNKNT